MKIMTKETKKKIINDFYKILSCSKNIIDYYYCCNKKGITFEINVIYKLKKIPKKIII